MRVTGRTWTIVNPAAGGGRAGREWPALAARLRAVNVDFAPCVTCGPGDAVRCARAAVAAGATTIAVVGGDGTLNEVVDGCLTPGPADGSTPLPTLALLPIGTGADFARGLGVGGGDAALATLIGGVERPIDAGRVTFLDAAGTECVRHFVNVADFGLGPATSEHTPRGNRRFGAAAFLWGALVAIAGYAPAPVRVEIDDVLAYEGPSGIVAVANGHRFGGGMRVAPKARLDDGLFDVVILGPVSRRALVTDLLPRVYRGTHLRHPDVHLGRGAIVTVKAAGHFPIELDGEVVGFAPARFELLPGALRVLAPS